MLPTETTHENVNCGLSLTSTIVIVRYIVENSVKLKYNFKNKSLYMIFIMEGALSQNFPTKWSGDGD